MNFPAPLVEARVLARYKRFLADVRLPDGSVVTAHCANPGSMLGILDERVSRQPVSSGGEPPAGQPCHLSFSPGKGRKLPLTLELVEVDRALVSVNTGLTNRVVEHALRDGLHLGTIPGASRSIRREVAFGPGCRFDFEILDGAQRTLMEVKSVTLADAGVAYFPDSVTSRGLKHLSELCRAREQGLEAILLFWVNRSDCDLVRPARWIDPAYGLGLSRAAAAGVRIHAVSAQVTPEGITQGPAIPVDLSEVESWSRRPRWLPEG